MTVDINGPNEIVLKPENPLEAAMLAESNWTIEIDNKPEFLKTYTPTLTLKRKESPK